MQYTYKGHADRLEFTKSDFDRHGIDQGAVHFDAKNNFTTDLSEEAANFLKDQGHPLEQVEEAPAVDEGVVNDPASGTKNTDDQVGAAGSPEVPSPATATTKKARTT